MLLWNVPLIRSVLGMYHVNCLNLISMTEFTKDFEFYDDFRKFINRCRYSKKIKVTSWFKD